jgi:hypothetical protein
MNTIKTMLTIAALATVLFATQSCNNKNNHHDDDMHNSGMHDDHTIDSMNMYPHTQNLAIDHKMKSKKRYKCPKCGMNLEKMSTDMMKDSAMMHNMMGNMMNNPRMMGDMMQMMQKEGIMSQECMQSCLKMMGNKGLDMGNMMQDGSMKNHELHNH